MSPQESPFSKEAPLSKQEAATRETFLASPEDRRAAMKRAKLRLAEESQAKQEDSEIARMLREEIEKEGDIFPSIPLEPEEFKTREPVKSSAVEISGALRALSDPERARQIYEETKLREEVDAAFDKITDDKKKRSAN